LNSYHVALVNISPEVYSGRQQDPLEQYVNVLNGSNEHIHIAYLHVPVILMKGADMPISAPRTLYSFNTPADIKQFATGCDGDIGGLSTVHFDLDERPKINKSIGKAATGMFWGDMRTQVKPGMEKKIRGGYAGFRNKVCFFAKKVFF
jgi:Complex I intermediate-associated protein 30 (CIA30)